MPSSNLVCIYHKNCLDGFGAAWVVKRFADKFNHSCEFIPMGYDDTLNPSIIKDKKVIIVDFSFKRNVMWEIAELCDSLTVIDHHESAQRELDGLEEEMSDKFQGKSFVIYFDMTKSGALLTYGIYFNNQPPLILQIISDRDLWKFEMSSTKPVTEALFMYPFEFDTWDRLFGGLEDEVEGNILMLQREGLALIKKKTKEVLDIANATAYLTDWNGLQIPVANAPFTVASDLGNLLCQGYPFSITYYMTKDNQCKVSLRSDKNCPSAANVSLIAEEFGGGGHKNAAGYHTKYPDFVWVDSWVKK